MNRFRLRIAAPLIPLLGLASCAAPQGTDASPTRPAGPWLQYADPAEAGFDAAALKRVCGRADSLRSGAVMAVFRGHVLFACGAVDRPLEAHSVRKSLVSGLFGTAVARDEVRVEGTLAEYAIDDDTPLTPEEASATVHDLLSARSGVYLPAAYAPEDQDRARPERGSHPPGTHWFYNNWDFNVAGVLYESVTGEDLYRSFGRRIAEPLGMEDWAPGHGFRVYEPTLSRHPAHTIRISARDLARFGQLYLQGGRWGGSQVLPTEWVERSTRSHTQFEDGTGYGYMWWTYPAGSLDPEAYPTLTRTDLYMGRGTGGQALWVVPAADLVVVHRGDTHHGREVMGVDAWALAEAVLAARRGDPVSEPRLTSLQPTPLASQLPPLELPEYRALPHEQLRQYLGEYQMAPGARIRVFLHRGQPYMHLPGEGDALLLPLGDDRFTIRVVHGVGIRFERDPAGQVSAVSLTLGERRIRAERVH